MDIKKIIATGAVIAALSLGCKDSPLKTTEPKPKPSTESTASSAESKSFSKDGHFKDYSDDLMEYYSYTREYSEFLHYGHYSSGDFIQDRVHLYRALESTNWIITDGGFYGKNDGLVDRVVISGPKDWTIKPRTWSYVGDCLVLSREEDYEKYKEEFDQADKLLAKAKEKAEGEKFIQKFK